MIAAGDDVSHFSNLDLIAIGYFLALWIGYTHYADHRGAKNANLIGTMAAHRDAWMRQMLGRDNRMVDLQIIRNLTRTGVFFASTSILILAGLVTVMGAADKAIGLFEDLPLVSRLGPLEVELRLAAMCLIFIYAFFKFAWSIRQLSYCTIQIGAMDPSSALKDECDERCLYISQLATLAAKHSNRGLRSYYFAMALLAWFLHPYALIAATTFVVLVMYRREFRSRTLQILRDSRSTSEVRGE